VLRHGLPDRAGAILKIERQDYFGNGMAIHDRGRAFRGSSFTPATRLTFADPILPMLALSAPWEHVVSRARRSDGEHDIAVLQFVSASRHTRVAAEVLDYARPSFPPHRPILEAALDLTQRIYDDFTFDSTATDISTPVSHVLQERRGVCQDFAHLAITCLRGLGLPARYVSGYLLTYPPPGMEKLQGADASHAWISVWAPEVGRVDFDPTNGVIPSEEHVTVAYGRDYDDVSPISGVLLGGSRQTMSVAVDVTVAG
jgi:transglutaminase-like putative cysteine protease